MMMKRRCRTALFLPASNARAMEKVRHLACDTVILDLEDAVAPEAKAAARDAAVAAAHQGFGDRRLVVRANAAGTVWHDEDLAALAGAPVDAVLLPKLDDAGSCDAARRALGENGPALWAMIETARGLMALPALAAGAARWRLEALVAGTNDLALDLRCRPDAARTPLVPHLAAIVATARAGGMIALDGVLNAIKDEARLAAECAQGAMLGFDGKTLIHPGQIAIAQAAFGPTDAELAWAARVVAAFAAPEADGCGAIALDGAMVERLHLAEAERLLAEADTPSSTS